MVYRYLSISGYFILKSTPFVLAVLGEWNPTPTSVGFSVDENRSLWIAQMFSFFRKGKHWVNPICVYWAKVIVIHWMWPPPSNSDHQDYYIFSRESLYKPSFTTVTGRGPYPSYTHFLNNWTNVQCKKNTFIHHVTSQDIVWERKNVSKQIKKWGSSKSEINRWYTNQLMVNCWFGARWFGFRTDPRKWKGLGFSGVPLESQTTSPNQQLTISWTNMYMKNKAKPTTPEIHVPQHNIVYPAFRTIRRSCKKTEVGIGDDLC